MFELGQLRCFTTVAMELSFRRAAERLNMTQPPLSRQVQLLEHQLGVRLFERTTRSVTLTPAGRAFFIEANQLLERAQSAVANVKRIAQGEIGAINISFVSCAVYQFLPEVINRVKLSHPQIDINLREMPTTEQLEGVRLRQVDIGIVRAGHSRHGYLCESLLKEPFVLAAPRGHPLATAARPGPRDLDRQPFITYALSSWQPFYELFAGVFRANNVQPRYVHQIGSTVTILSLVNGGMGLALVPACAARIRFENVVFRDIELGEGVCSELSLIWRDDNDNPVLPVLLEALRRTVDGTSPPGGWPAGDKAAQRRAPAR
ncbi:LysR family transcriptional regulator [Acerihabitans arboris]|uniref:LysR family transcriptional regulator n=1 Tax=Acerihabitans arboris TaxID=2691583 RepID=A0A845SH69_9GAMM|nr:LysR family transcriptional regulator [Acerihabitans arboris]NDL62274.1 LysR family transcriptional regulator [Acerihabitans arboris]